VEVKKKTSIVVLFTLRSVRRALHGVIESTRVNRLLSVAMGRIVKGEQMDKLVSFIYINVRSYCKECIP
jgi:hypothetical protein